MTVSGKQRKDSAIHRHVSILPQTPLASRLPHNIEQPFVCSTVGPCWLSILNGIPYMWNLKRIDTNELSYKTKRLINLENELMVARGKGEGKDIREFGVELCTLLYCFIILILCSNF